jgi:hypothetical protein
MLTAGVPALAGDAVRDAVPGTIRRLDLQTTIPHAAEAEEPSRLFKIPEFEIRREALWVLAAFGAVVLAYILRDMLPGWRARDDQGWDTGISGLAGGGATPPISLAEADALAGQGRFVEAMHVLLLFCLADIRRRLDLDFADSLTSREIVRRAKLPEDGTAALRGIVTRVELSYFGDYPASRADYDACRERYEVLAGMLPQGSRPMVAG